MQNFLGLTCTFITFDDVAHTLVFFSRLSLSESIHMPVFALPSSNQVDFLTFGVVVLICLIEEGEIIWGLKLRCTKSAVL